MDARRRLRRCSRRRHRRGSLGEEGSPCPPSFNSSSPPSCTFPANHPRHPSFSPSFPTPRWRTETRTSARLMRTRRCVETDHHTQDSLPDGLFLGGAPANVACHLNELGKGDSRREREGGSWGERHSGALLIHIPPTQAPLLSLTAAKMARPTKSVVVVIVVFIGREKHANEAL